MAFPGEVGLQLLLSPLGSNVVVRTACCTVGLVLPVYSTFKAIENKDQNEQQKWLFYWAAYGSFSIAEVFTDKLLSWFPLYYHVKFAFLVWLQLPSINGARQLYMSHLRPFLLRHQARLDQIVDLVYSEMGKFVSKHQSEIQFASALSIKILRSVREIVHPRQTQIHGTIEGPRRQIQDAPPDDDDDDVEE
ncbi:HVA22-like protein k isoform X4 [Tripterygium wilfordii]|uniref:HVA22-like protein k isoform X4 n=1 Tax=Tripterygium wilfordii TaxID=458696 RepID=UPI0018F7F04F|nr:HVA22-like protein k isoform X4 [Tripterygium wilfordii]